MTAVERGQLGFSKPLDNCEDSGVDKSEREIPITINQFANAAVVAWFEIGYGNAAGLNIGQKTEERVRLKPLPRKPVELGQHR